MSRLIDAEVLIEKLKEWLKDKEMIEDECKERGII